MNVFLEIIRPQNAIMGVIAVFLIAFITRMFIFDVLIACGVVFIIMGAGNTLNDYFDRKIDAVNKPDRPIPSRRISAKTAFYYASFLFFLGNILAYYINLSAGIIASFSSVLLILYASKFKKTVLLGNIDISFLTGLTFIFGGVVVGDLYISYFLGFYAFLMTMAREIVKDMEDMEGDRLDGAKTFPIIYGKTLSSQIAAYFMIIASLTSPILYFIGIFNVFYLAVLILAIIIFLYCAKSILEDQSLQSTQKISKRLKIGMSITFLAFALGSPWIYGLI
jgi:geranylgeranylglycerol-phosphate geranylgeranyltransferase